MENQANHKIINKNRQVRSSHRNKKKKNVQISLSESKKAAGAFAREWFPSFNLNQPVYMYIHSSVGMKSTCLGHILSLLWRPAVLSRADERGGPRYIIARIWLRPRSVAQFLGAPRHLNTQSFDGIETRDSDTS